MASLGNQLRFIAGNVLGEVQEGIADIREGVVPQVKADAKLAIDEWGDKVDGVLEGVQEAVADLKASVLAKNV